MWKVCFGFKSLSLKNESKFFTIYLLIFQTYEDQMDLVIYAKSIPKKFLKKIYFVAIVKVSSAQLVSFIRNSV